MADQQELTIVIEAINKASEQLKQVEKDLGGLSQQIGKNNSVAKSATTGAESMFGAFVKGGLVVKGIEMAFGYAKQGLIALKNVMNESVEVAAKYEASMMGLSSIARSFGYDIDKTKEAAIKLSEDGLLTPAQSAEALKNVLASLSGATLEQGVAMVSAMKDTASFNRTLYDYGDAIIQTTRGMRNRNSILTDSAGVQKNLSIIMAEAGFELEDLDSGSKKYAATQALITGYLQESGFAFGDASRYLDTYLGKQTGLKSILLDVKRLLGDAVMPIFEAFTDVLKTSAAGLQSWLGANGGKIRTLAITMGNEFKNVIESVGQFFERNKDIFKGVFNFIIQAGSQIVNQVSMVWNSVQVLANGLEFAVRSVVNAGKILYNAVKGDWGGVVDSYDEWLNKSAAIQGDMIGNMQDFSKAQNQVLSNEKFDIDKWWASIASTTKETRKEMETDAKNSGTKISNEDIKTLQKIAKENEKYKREVEKRAKVFEESFDDLIIQHRDTIKQLTTDLATESKDYQKKVTEMLSEYDDGMEEIKASHKEKTESVMADMEAERKKAEEEIEKLTEAYNEEVGLIEKEGEDRVGNLQSQLDRELALGDNANTKRIASLQAMIALEKSGLSDSLDDKKAKHDEEVADVNEKLNESLTAIQKELDAENVAYEIALAKRKEQYDQDVSDAKESYENKRIELQTELDTEVAIREKYAEDFKRIGDRIALDDITRLINKNNEEKAEAELEHQERLAEMKGDAFDEGLSTANSYSDGLSAGYPNIKSKFDQIKSDITNLSDSISAVSNGSKVGDYYTPWNIPTGVGSNTPSYGATGGLFSKPTVIGEAGAEVVLPLSFPKRMDQIMKSMGMNGGGGARVSQNFYVTINNPQDIDLLMEKAAFAMRNQGGLT